jgi:hypothetical protein
MGATAVLSTIVAEDGIGRLIKPVYVAVSGKLLGQFFEMWKAFRQWHFLQLLLLLSCSCSAFVSAARQGCPEWAAVAVVPGFVVYALAFIA